MKEFRIDLESFIVKASNETEAKKEAYAQLNKGWVPHIEDIEEIESLEDFG